MEDPTGGMWIYLIFFMIPLVRILPRIIRKYKRKNAGLEPEPEPAEKYNKKRFFSRERPEPPRYTEEPPPEPEPEPDSKGDWMKKDDFK
jgi:hypothetical protein